MEGKDNQLSLKEKPAGDPENECAGKDNKIKVREDKCSDLLFGGIEE